jgi:hypothetical protein
MSEFTYGLLKITGLGALVIFGMILGVSSAEKDMERACKKTGEYTTVMKVTIHCEKDPDAVHSEDKHHNHKH